MDAEIVIQGDQILYTNEFDELTYNADKIVEMTSQLDDVLKRFSYSFSSKDSALIINKNLTSFLYWLVIDSLYFVPNTSYEVQRINYLRKKKNSNKYYLSGWSQPFSEQKFITKMRLLAHRNQSNFNLAQIRQTKAQQLIGLFQKQHENISQRNDQIMNTLSNKALQDKQRFHQILKKFEIDPQEANSSMVYYKFQKQMIREWMDQVQRKKYGPKCQICSRTDKLIKCQKCDMYVHAFCYPKLPKLYKQPDFLCQNCQKNLDQNTACIFCPIRGGNFLQVQTASNRKPVYTLIKDQNNTLKLRIKKKIVQSTKTYIHLSCSLWHPQIQYNIKTGMIQNIHRVDRKKTQNPCYECGTNIGVTIPCANENCRRFYHPECARLIDLSTCIIIAKNKLLIQLYCQRHRRPFIYEKLKQNILNNLKQIKKLYQGIDHQIKRMLSSSYTSDRRIYVKHQDPQRFQTCEYCSRPHDNLSIPIINCSKCYNWYHKHCGNKCIVCQQNPLSLMK